MLHSLIDLSLIVIGLLGLLVTVLLLFSYKSNPWTNIYLVLILTISSFRLIHRGIFEIYQPFILETTFKWLNPIYLIIIPCFYLYFKLLLNNKQNSYKDLLHFIYPIINILFVVILKKDILLIEGIPNFIQFWRTIFFIAIYLILSFQLLNNKLWKNNNLKLTSDKHYPLIKSWAKFFYVIAFLLVFRLLFSLYLENHSTEKLSGFSLILFSIVLWLVIFIKILIHPGILYGFPKLEEKLSEYHNNTSINSAIWQLSTTEITNLQDQKLTTGIENKIIPYAQDIEDLTSTTQPFRNPNFSIKELSITLCIPTSHLTYLFKYHCTMPFVEYKKYCRIEDAITLMNSNYLKKSSLESLSSEIGFISYNTFYSAFKKHNKVSPKEYTDSIN